MTESQWYKNCVSVFYEKRKEYSEKRCKTLLGEEHSRKFKKDCLEKFYSRKAVVKRCLAEQFYKCEEKR